MSNRMAKSKSKIAIWLIVPLCLIFTVELGVRHRINTAWSWYPSETYLIQKGADLDAIFIGNSRVGAAIETNFI